MKVFKFGGASVKDANAVKNVVTVLNRFPHNDIVVVVSAMGKTTNALEYLTNAYFYKTGNASEVLESIKKYHFDILEQLFPDKNHSVYTEINNSFVELHWAIEEEPAHTYNHEYDQIVSIGELISSKIVSAYLKEMGIDNKWFDVRDIIQTDNTYREGKVDWQLTQELGKSLLTNRGVILTQGFIGGTSENFSTTLGREGSDYSAAILAFITNAESVTIWKDVPGVLNADPKYFDDAKKLDQLSYHDAIELAYYGATVIHPKTIKPLQNKQIPLYVKSFLNPDEEGTVINKHQSSVPVPSFIFKRNQVLLSISPKDFSFIVEENLSDIFKLFSQMQLKMNMMQNSAISFSVCIDGDERKLPELIKLLQTNYRVLYNENLELITIRYYDTATIERVTHNKQVLVEVKTRHTIQMVVKPLQ